jgi:hypothetical protein
MTDVRNSHRSAFAPLGDVIHDLSTAEAKLREAQQAAWRRYLDEVDRILAEDLHRDDKAEVDELAHQLFEGIRMRLDDMRVQARLGTMEGEDLLAQLRGALEHLVGRVVHLPRL